MTIDGSRGSYILDTAENIPAHMFFGGSLYHVFTRAQMLASAADDSHRGRLRLQHENDSSRSEEEKIWSSSPVTPNRSFEEEKLVRLLA
jgi:hypothetical protein